MMVDRIRRPLLGSLGVRRNLATVWGIIVIGMLTALFGTGIVLNESLAAYSICAARTVSACTDASWFSSMSVVFFGGFAAVIVGGAFGIRRRDRANCIWYPLAGLGGTLLSTAAALVVLKTATNT